MEVGRRLEGDGVSVKIITAAKGMEEEILLAFVSTTVQQKILHNINYQF